MNIFLISQYFHPENFRINDIAAEWVKRGHRVTVLTGIPNYPAGRFFEGYGFRKKRREVWKGIRIIRIPLIPRGKTPVGMVLNYFSFMLSGLWWVRRHRVRADLVFSFETSPMTQVMIGCKYSRKHHIPHFLYVQDLWPENVETVTGIRSPLVIGPINRMVDYIYRNTDRIFVTSPSFKEAIVHRKRRVSPDKVSVWPQYAEDAYQPMERAAVRMEALKDPSSPVHQIPEDDGFHIAFTGNIGMAQGLDLLPRTAALLRKASTKTLTGERQAEHAGKNSDITRPVRFIIVGDGRYRQAFETEIDRLGVREYFIMIPRQPAERIPQILACCDAAFVSFADDPLWEKTIPAKLQSYMACGMPVIAAAGGATRRVVEEAGCGWCCDVGDEIALADTIRCAMREDTRETGRKALAYSKKHFSKEKLLEVMDEYMG